MPRKKQDEDKVDKNTLFLSMYMAMDRSVKALSMHTAYDGLCEDIRNLLKLAKPHVEKYLETKTVMSGTTETEQ